MSEMKSDKVLFGDVTLATLMENVYTTSSIKRRQLESMIVELKKLIKSTRDAEMISPIIKEFFDVAIKNDEQVLKLATIAQRILLFELKEEGEEALLTEEEREQLISKMDDVKAEADKIIKENEDKFKK